MPTATEQALIDAYGDPRGILDQSVMTNILGLTDAPAIDPGGLVNVQTGGPISTTNVYGQTGNFPIQQAPWAGASEIGSFLSPELESQRNLLDKLFASGVMAAPEGYESSVDATDALREAQHAMSSDTYGYQAGLKAALAKQGGPWQSSLYGGKQILSNLLGSQPDILKEVKESESARALEAYNAAQDFRVNDESKSANVPFPISLIPAVEAHDSVEFLPAPYLGPIGEEPSRTEWFGRRSDDVRFPYPETGFQAPDYNRMDRVSAALQNLGPGSSASQEDQAKSAQIIFSEAMEDPVFNQDVISFGPRAVREAIRSRDISRLPTYEAPAFTGGSIDIPEGLPANKPFPESVTKLPEAVELISAPPPQIRKSEPQPEVRQEPEKPQAVKPKPVKPKPAKTQSQTTAARRKRTSTKAKVNKVAKETKVPKSAASEALSRARGDANKAIMIAPVIHHFTEKKKKDPTVYVPSIRVGPTGQWIGGL